MVVTLRRQRGPFGLVVTGEANWWVPALEEIVGPRWLRTFRVSGDEELLEMVESGLADAAVLDEEGNWDLEVLQLLRMIRRLSAAFPVVVLSRRTDRIWLEDALGLAAFSVVAKPLQLEELLRQIQRMMIRLDQTFRAGPL